MATDIPKSSPSAPTANKRSTVTTRVTSGFRALRIRNYRLFSISQLVSLAGSWMQTTAQAWLVLQLTQSPLALGIVTTLQFLPITLLALYGGVLADRLPKRQTIIVTQTVAMVQAFIFGLLVSTGAIQLWHIYLLAVIQGIISAIDNPVRQAFVVEMVGREDLVNAVALNSMIFNGARILGPAIAGIVIAKIGIAPTLYLNALSFIGVIVALFMMDTKALYTAPPSATGSVRKRLMEGLAYTWRTPRVLLIMIIIGAIGTFGYNFSIVLPLLARFVLNTDAGGFGALSSFLGIGSFIAAMTTAYTRNVTMRRLFIGSAAFSVLLGAVAISPDFGLSAVLLVALGFSGIIFATSSNTLLQLIVPDELRGRVMSLNILLFMGSTPIGGLLIGVLSKAIGVSATLLLCAVLCLAGVLFAVFYQRKFAPVPAPVQG